MRPHHVETLTHHVSSIKDNVLNTRYYSHYEATDPNSLKKDETTETISCLESTMARLKDELMMYKMRSGIFDPDQEEEL